MRATLDARCNLDARRPPDARRDSSQLGMSKNHSLRTSAGSSGLPKRQKGAGPIGQQCQLYSMPSAIRINRMTSRREDQFAMHQPRLLVGLKILQPHGDSVLSPAGSAVSSRGRKPTECENNTIHKPRRGDTGPLVSPSGACGGVSAPGSPG